MVAHFYYLAIIEYQALNARQLRMTSSFKKLVADLPNSYLKIVYWHFYLKSLNWLIGPNLSFWLFLMLGFFRLAISIKVPLEHYDDCASLDYLLPHVS